MAPGNTLASFEAALDHDVDIIEFDVMRHRGRLVLAHDPEDARSRELITLAEGLDHFASPRFLDIGLDIDMKHAGFELELVEELAKRNLQERTIVTTMHKESLDLIRSTDRAISLGWTIPKLSRDWTKEPKIVQLVVFQALIYMRRVLPAKVARAVRDGEVEVVTAYAGLVTSRLLRLVHEAGGEVYAWTVDDVKEIKRLEALGVDGLVTNDPRLFDQLGSGYHPRSANSAAG